MTSFRFQRQKAHALRLAFLFLICIGLLACELEEMITIRPDGSGTYRARLLIDKQFAEALPEIKAKAQAKGYRVTDEAGNPEKPGLLFEKNFKEISELNEDTNTYLLSIDRSNRLKIKYSLAVEVRTAAAASGFQKKTMRVRLPGKVVSATAGAIDGQVVTWDSTAGGRLAVEAARSALPFGVSALGLALIVLVVGILVAALLGRGRGATTCLGCGAAQQPGASFCESCGAGVQASRQLSRSGVLVAILLAGAAYAVLSLDSSTPSPDLSNTQTSVVARAAAPAPVPGTIPPGAPATSSVTIPEAIRDKLAELAIARVTLSRGASAGDFSFTAEGTLLYRGRPFMPPIAEPNTIGRFEVAARRGSGDALAIGREIDGWDTGYLLDTKTQAAVPLRPGPSPTLCVGCGDSYWSPSGRYVVVHWGGGERGEGFVVIDTTIRKIAGDVAVPEADDKTKFWTAVHYTADSDGRRVERWGKPRWNGDPERLFFTIGEMCNPYQEGSSACSEPVVQATYAASLDPATLKVSVDHWREH